MRERGYDVQARLRNDGGYEKDISKWYNNPPKFTHLTVPPLTKDESNDSRRERAQRRRENGLSKIGRNKK